MKNTRTSLEIISWRAGAMFEGPLTGVFHTFLARQCRFLLAPGFSRVFEPGWIAAASAAFGTKYGKPLKRFLTPYASHTRLKPGANEKNAALKLNICEVGGVINVTPAKAARFQFGKNIAHRSPKLALALLAFTWLMGSALLAEDTTNAPSLSNTNTPAPLPTNAVALPKTNAPPHSATNALVVQDYSSFNVIADRSIFDPNRSRRSTRGGGGGGPERKAVKVESFTLVGTMSYAKGELAFFDGSESQYRKAFKPQGTIAGYKLTVIAANSVKLEKDGKTIEMFMGAQMKKRDDDPWELTASSLNLFSTGGRTSKPSAPRA